MFLVLVLIRMEKGYRTFCGGFELVTKIKETTTRH